MSELKIFDATLRDGSHAIAHQLELDTIKRYCKMNDDTGLYTIIVGHGNGLGASSLQVGLSKNSDRVMLKTAKESLNKTKLGIYMIPGFGTIQDNLIPAIEIGVDLFKIGCHCTEADTMKQHIEFLNENKKEVYGVLMSTHMASCEKLTEEAKKIEDYGAKGVILMDSAGALVTEDVTKRVEKIKNHTELEIGFHAHNNLNLSIANTLVAIDAGANIIDGTSMGFGAGAGNCQLEVIVAILQKRNLLKHLDLYNLMDVAQEIISKELDYKKGLEGLTIISGISGIFSAFSKKVDEASKKYNIDPRDIFIELGKRKVVGGQEDMIIDVAMNLAQTKSKDATSYMMESLL
ncbi:MAG: 4-hydroxy-2-oxovalerate aldolase [Candidatus Gastranaerophilales bacterium]